MTNSIKVQYRGVHTKTKARMIQREPPAVQYTAPMDHKRPSPKPIKPPVEGNRSNELKRVINRDTKLTREERLKVLVRIGNERGPEYLRHEIEVHHAKIDDLTEALRLMKEPG